VAFKVGKPLLQNLLRKTLYSRFESGRGLLDLQLSYSPVDAVLFKEIEICVLKQRVSKTKWVGRDVELRRRTHAAPARVTTRPGKYRTIA
jgi:hypothetical protein